MRIRFGAALALATAAWMVVPLNPAQADPEKASGACTIVGTPGRDVLRGTNHDDVICGLGGNDKISGRGGDDVLQGGGGDDLIIGGSGDDVLGGGRGDDTLNGLDNATAKDRLRCGRGEDTAKADPPDIPRPRCEHVEQNHAPTDLSLAPSSVAENQPAGTTVGTLTATDPDASDPHTFALVAGTGSADNGSFTVVGSTLRTAVSLDFETTPTRSVRVRTTDSGGLSVEKALTITVTDVDDPPVAVDDTKTLVEDAAATAIDVLANDTDTDGGPKNVASVTQPTDGTVVITGGGSGLTYQPAANYCNGGSPTDDFTYTLNGGDVGAVKVTVTCVDDDPVAVDDAKTVAEDDAATAIDVLANDTDVDAGPKSVQSVTQPANGNVVITGGGTGLTYAPSADYCNDGTPTDNFTYTLSPGGSSATVRVTVTCDDDPPVAVNDTGTVAEDDAATPVPVLSNDTDIDGGPKTIASTTQPTNGTVAIIGGGAGLTYAPDPNYCNDPPGTSPDSFTYTVNGGSSATVSMTVTCADDAPVAVDDSKTVAEDDPAAAVNVLANDTDVDGGPVSISSVTQPADGTVVITGGGTGLTYQPNANYCNNPPGTSPDTFTYTLAPGSSTATVSVTVTCADDDPVAVNDSATVAEDSGASAVTVLANDTDIDGGPKSIASVTQPANGTVVITGGGTGLTYAPNANYCNSPPGTTPDTFTYSLTPGGSSATVSMTVTCVDDAPVAVDDAAAVVLDAPATAVNVLANDTDIDGGPMSISSASDPTNGTVVITGGGAGLTYQPDAGYCNDGSPFDTFTYTLNGGSSATVRMTVTCDVAPTAVDDSATVAEDAAATAVTVLANDTDPDGGPKSVASVTQPANGAVAITGGGTGLTYAPNANYCNSPPGTTLDTFTYSLSPGGSTATVSMTVTCVNDAPVAVDDSATVAEDSGANPVNVLANDTDIDGGTMSVQSVTQPANGTVAITGGGTGVSYTPNPDFCGGPDTFTYTLNGGSVGTVSMTVTCVADAPVVTAGGTLVYVENDPATIIAPALTVTDPDAGATITGATVQITGNYAGAQDVLAMGGLHAPITATFSGDTLTLTGTDSPAAYQSALRDVTYVNTSEAPSALQRTVTFTVTDDTALSGSTSRFVSVTPVDDNPVAVNDSFQGIEDSGAVAVLVLANDTDVDAGPKSVASVTQPANGTVVITGGGTGLTYAPNANYCNDPPGTSPDTFTYTLSPGGSSATVSVKVTCVNDAPVADDENFNGANSAIGNTTLVVDDPTDGPPSATGPKKTITGDVLAGDTDVDGDTLSVVAETINTGGGTVVIEADGDFTLLPPAGCATPYSFDYTVTDGGSPALTDTGTVTVAVTECVWYVDPAAAAGGDGRSNAPFQTLTPLNGAGGAGDVDDDSDYLFLASGSSYSTGLGLESNQRLFGGSHGLSVASTTLVAAGGANPTISNPSGNGLALSTGNNVQGINLGSTPAGNAALSGSGVGTATMNTVTSGSINNATGGAVDLSNGTLNMAFTSVTSIGATGDGIRLDNAAGSFTGSGGSLQNAGGQDVDLSGNNVNDTVDFTYDGTITDDVGQLVSVANQNLGTKDFNGLITDGNDGDGGGISLSASAVATVRFDGGLILSTGANPAFSATGGGTVVVNEPIGVDNSLTTTTGTALNVANTAIGADGLHFTSISANGATNGVVLNNTGSTAGLTISGNGGSCGSAATCTGGAILNTTSAVSLTSTRDVSIDRMFIQNTVGDGIDGTTTTNFSFTNGRIDNSGTGLGAETSNIGFNTTAAGTENNLSGVVTITGNTLTNPYYHGIDIFNFNGTIADATISGNTITSTTSTATSKGTGIRLVAFGSASTVSNVTKATIANNAVSNFPSANGILASGGNGNAAGPAGDLGTVGSGTNVIAITGNTLIGNPKFGAFGIATTVNGKGQGNVNVSGNSVTNSIGTAISLGSFGFANLTATVNNNTVVANNNVGAQGIGAGTSQTFGATDTPTLTISAVGNNISQTDGNGILITARDATGQVNATVKDNNVAAPLSGNRNGIRVDAGNGVSVDDDVCLDISGNTSAGSGLSPEAIGLRKQGTSTTVNAFGVEGMAATTSPLVEVFVSGQQDAGSQSTLLISAISGFSNCSSAP